MHVLTHSFSHAYFALSDSSLNGCLKAAGSRSCPVNSLPSFLWCQLSARGDASADERTCLTCCYWHKQHTRTMLADCRTFVNNFLTAVIVGHSKCKVVPYSRLINFCWSILKPYPTRHTRKRLRNRLNNLVYWRLTLGGVPPPSAREGTCFASSVNEKMEKRMGAYLWIKATHANRTEIGEPNGLDGFHKLSHP